MWNNAYCGDGQCGPYAVTKEDQVALLKEKEKILEAKLATVRHLIESAGKEKTEQK